MVIINKGISPCGVPDEEDLKLINAYTRREYTKDELYTFSVTLCDNEVDRDIEKFSDDALEKLSQLFVGKTGISDHVPSAMNQQARIYSCKCEKPSGVKNSIGEDYCRVVAKAYIPKSEGNEEFINSIDSGIRKEVSIGCAIGKKTCSICGTDLNRGYCEHKSGESYDGALCYTVLSDPQDAYEWSFVAVPAQKNAGVIKSFKTKGSINMETILKSLTRG